MSRKRDRDTEFIIYFHWPLRFWLFQFPESDLCHCLRLLHDILVCVCLHIFLWYRMPHSVPGPTPQANSCDHISGQSKKFWSCNCQAGQEETVRKMRKTGQNFSFRVGLKSIFSPSCSISFLFLLSSTKFPISLIIKSYFQDSFLLGNLGLTSIKKKVLKESFWWINHLTNFAFREMEILKIKLT